MSLHDRDGQRKYLNQKERLRFLEATKGQATDTRLFCQLLFFTGARISEIHNLIRESIDRGNEAIVIESLKKRKRGVYREIPLPSFLLTALLSHIEENQIQSMTCLWSFSLRTASRRVKHVMKIARIGGEKGSAKGLRHGFAVSAVSKVPITLVKKWLGHGALETTEIYLNMMGSEEREMAKRLW